MPCINIHRFTRMRYLTECKHLSSLFTAVRFMYQCPKECLDRYLLTLGSCEAGCWEQHRDPAVARLTQLQDFAPIQQAVCAACVVDWTSSWPSSRSSIILLTSIIVSSPHPTRNQPVALLTIQSTFLEDTVNTVHWFPNEQRRQRSIECYCYSIYR